MKKVSSLKKQVCQDIVSGIDITKKDYGHLNPRYRENTIKQVIRVELALFNYYVRGYDMNNLDFKILSRWLYKGDKESETRIILKHLLDADWTCRKHAENHRKHTKGMKPTFNSFQGCESSYNSSLVSLNA